MRADTYIGGNKDDRKECRKEREFNQDELEIIKNIAIEFCKNILSKYEDKII